jgi:hypothetical protein
MLLEPWLAAIFTKSLGATIQSTIALDAETLGDCLFSPIVTGRAIIHNAKDLAYAFGQTEDGQVVTDAGHPPAPVSYKTSGATGQTDKWAMSLTPVYLVTLGACGDPSVYKRPRLPIAL